MNHYGFSCLIASISSFVVGILVYCKNKDRWLNRLWALFEFSIVVWCFCQFIESLVSSPSWALFWNRILFLGVIFIPVFFLHAVLIFLDLQKKIIKILIYLCAATFSASLAITSMPLLVKDVVFRPSFGYYSVPGVLYNIFFIFFGFCVFYAFFLMFANLGLLSGLKKQQLKYIITGTSIGFITGFFNFLPAYNLATYPFINYIFALFHLPLLFAVIKYRLLDIKIVATRSGIFFGVYSIILGLPLVLIYYGQNYFVYYFGVSWWMVPFLCSIALAALGPFLYIYFDKKAEDRLLKEQRNYQNILKSASSGMIRIRSLDFLLKLIVYVVAKIVRIKYVSIYLYDAEHSSFILRASRMATGIKIYNTLIDVHSCLIRSLTETKEPLITEEIALRLVDKPKDGFLSDLMSQLVSLSAALIIPSFVEDRLIGILVLGEKRSGKIYSQDDLAVFSVLANQAALAIENAQFYEEIRKTQESLFQAEKMATIGTMADGLSHQINNRFHALSLIAGDAMDVLKTYDCSQHNEETRQIFNDLKNSLERIQANVLQGGEVVRGLLKYSRPGECGFERISFKEVLDGAVEMVSYKIKLREIDFVKDMPSHLPCLNANIVQLQEVFFNLIDNAYDAIKERQMILNEHHYRGRIEISVMTDQTFFHINVQDNGIGIKPEDKQKVFTPFFTTKATAKKGTGLGLYVIQKIISAHNGQIRMNSVYRSGTCFTISLPIKPTLAAA
ncbi:MAG: ATP-binding protein [Candidatus Velamenicoccus archaeovorus]